MSGAATASVDLVDAAERSLRVLQEQIAGLISSARCLGTDDAPPGMPVDRHALVLAEASGIADDLDNLDHALGTALAALSVARSDMDAAGRRLRGLRDATIGYRTEVSR